MQMQRLLYDMRFGVRMLLKSPAVTAVAVISLALGISVALLASGAVLRRFERQESLDQVTQAGE